MRYQDLKLFIMLLACFSFTKLQAQSSINASGGNAQGNGGTVSYSVGQSIYQTYTGNGGYMAAGIQQTYEIVTVGTDEAFQDLSLSVFPNPATENLTLKIEEYNNEKLSFQLFDAQGRALNQGQIKDRQTEIDMRSNPAAMYFFYVLNQHNKIIKTFKIVKK